MRSKKKKKHIIFYDDEIWKKLSEIKKSEVITYDELLKNYLKLPDSDQVIRFTFEQVEDMIVKKYKNEELRELMDMMWIFIMKSAKGEYDIRKLKYNFEADISKQIYRKR